MIAAQRRLIEFERPASGAFDERGSSGYVPFIFRNQSEGEVGAASSDEAKFIGDRAHRTNIKFGGFELLPLTAFHFAAAGEDERPVQILALAGLRGFAVIGDAGVAGPENQFVGSRIADSARDGNTIFHHGDRDAELGNALHEFAGSIERIDNPHALLVEAGEIVNRFLRKPAFTRAQQVFLEDGVDRAIGRRYGIVPNFKFGFNGAGSEAVKHRARRFESGVDAFESIRGIRRRHQCSVVNS